MQVVVVSLVVFGALRFVLEKFWLGQPSSVDNFDMNMFLKLSPSSSTFVKRILVVLPLVGLKNTGPIEDDVVTEERLAIQSWNLLAEHLAAAAPSSHSPNGPLRVLGMVGALSECDPKLHRFTNPNHYACQVLPVECLQAKDDDIPMLNCLLETAVDEAKQSGEELLLFANGDVVFALDLLDVISSIYGGDSTLMNSTTGRSGGSHVVVVGQRTDLEVALDKTPLSLTREALLDLHSQAKAEGSLHQDFGIDYFIFPLEALPRRFPPFWVGRFRWDNALLATFLMQGATTVDATKTLSVVHFGVHSSDTAYHTQRLGADYNDELVHNHYNKAFMLGRISNTGWIHQTLTKTQHDEDSDTNEYFLVPREAPTDADLLRAFQMADFDSHAKSDAKGTKLQRDRNIGAGGANEYPTLLLITVSQQQDLAMLVEHSTVAAQSIPTHAMFVTKDPEIYAELDLQLASRTFLEQKDNWSSPAAAINWQTFGRLLTNSMAVVLTNASVWVESSERSSLVLEHPDWNLRTGDVALHPQNLDQVVGIRPTKIGLAFWEAYRDCHSGKRREEMAAKGNLSALGDWQSTHHHDQTQAPLTRVQCLGAIRTTFARHDTPSKKPFSKNLKMQGRADNFLDPFLPNASVAENKLLDHSVVNASAVSPSSYLPILREAQSRLDQVRHALDNTSACNTSSIPEKLHMVLTITNPGMYASRYILALDFIERIARHDSALVELYIVECAYEGQAFNITQASNPRHLQVRAATPLWHKENLINLAVARLLPLTWQALAWVDAEVEFESPTWAEDALHLLLHAKVADVIQLFSFAEDLGDKSETVNVYTGFLYNHVKQIAYQKKGVDLWHPGYAWGCSR